MNKVLGVLLLFVCALPGWSQASLEWMRATPAQRKKIEARRAREALEGWSYAGEIPAPLQQQTDIYLGTHLRSSQIQWIWQAQTGLLLPVPDLNGYVASPQKVFLPAWRWAVRKKLTLSTLPILSRKTAFSYRVDIEESDNNALLLHFFPVKNENGGNLLIKIKIFAQRLNGNRYGLYLQPYLVEETPEKVPEVADVSEQNNLQSAGPQEEALPAIQIGWLLR